MLEISCISSCDAKGEMVEENVDMALTFLGCGLESTTAEEIEAVMALLGMRAGTREELEGYLEVAARG